MPPECADVMENEQNLKQLRLSQIRLDGGTQSRAGLDERVYGEYAEHLDDLPPVIVFYDGSHYWLASGFHRYFAFKHAKKGTLPCIVKTGTVRDAILFSAGCNAEHGLRRKPEDKRHACRMLLLDPEWSKCSNREIARQCKVGHPLVADVRREIKEETKRQKEKEKADLLARQEQARREEEVKRIEAKANLTDGWVRPGKLVPVSEMIATPVAETSMIAESAHLEDIPDAQEVEEDVVTCERGGTTFQIQVGGLKSRRQFIEIETDPEVVEKLDQQIPRSFKKAATQAIRRGWSEHDATEYLGQMYRKLVGEGEEAHESGSVQEDH